jgi:hypothetical protein
MENSMRRAFQIFALTLLLARLPSLLIAQDDGPKAPPAGGSKPDPAAIDAIVARLMAFDKNKDGKLTRDEVTDERLLRLFDRADANKDGVVTKDELVALATKLVVDESAGGGRRRGFGPPGGPGGFGPGGFGGPPRPGQILPPFLEQELNLTDAQKQQIAVLQKEVDDKLAKVLTDQQKQQLKEMRRGPRPGGRGRRGPGGPGGGGPGDGGPDGPPGDGPSDRGPRGDRGPGPESDTPR